MHDRAGFDHTLRGTGLDVRIVMVQGAGDPRLDGVADYADQLTGALRTRGVDAVPVPVTGLRQVVRAIRAARPDVVHVQFAPSAFRFSPLPGLLPDLLRPCPPLVTTLHEFGSWSAPSWVPDRLWRVVERRRLFDRETWRLVARSAAVVTTNAGHAEVLRRRTGIDAVRVPLAPNVTDLTRAAPRAGTRRHLGVPADAQVVVFFGFVHPVKGLRYLIEAVAALRRAGRDRLHLLVVGGFTSLALPQQQARAFRAELEALIRTCGLADHVTITGHLPAEEVSAALRAADLAAFPFTAGATTKSGALLSAFAHRLPALVTAAHPPDPELVDGETVVVVPRVRDAGSLAAGLTRLLDDADLRERIRRGGTVAVAGRTWEAIAAAHRDLYTSLLPAEVVRA